MKVATWKDKSVEHCAEGPSSGTTWPGLHFAHGFKQRVVLWLKEKENEDR